MALKKNPKYDRPSLGATKPSGAKSTPSKPASLVFKDKPEYKGDQTD